MPEPVAPLRGLDDEFFWQGVEDGRLLVQRCASCARLRHPPAPVCSGCGSFDWRAEEMSGRGRVYSWILSQHPSQPDPSPRIVVLVELEEGVRMVSDLDGVEPDGIDLDMPVEVFFATLPDGARLPQFRPAPL